MSLASTNHVFFSSNFFFNFYAIQTNALASAQRRKMKGYGDFKRIAVVIIPSDEVHKERLEKQTAEAKTIVSEHALNEMKGNIHYFFCTPHLQSSNHIFCIPANLQPISYCHQLISGGSMR